MQGVGFRPYTYRLAASLGLSGFVRNVGSGAWLEVEGGERCIARFLERLCAEAPPLARIERVEAEEIELGGGTGFEILASDAGAADDRLISPDVATCDDCLAELFDPADRRYRYPFINCTNCGPRFTIVRGLPYDRALTTMASFAMCDACRSEYEDPFDRRFHAQPNACPTCGPSVRLVDVSGKELRDPDATTAQARDIVRLAANLLRRGAILAVKGLGGYHLACRADDEEVVARLRARKHREQKPFALLTADLDAACRLVDLDATDRVDADTGERNRRMRPQRGVHSGGAGQATRSKAAARALTCPERPIVLLPRRSDANVAEAVALGRRELGVMLPYSPLHHLLARDTAVPLVLTSGNMSDEPIAYQEEDALRRLRGIADAFLVHDRQIHTRTDDSVVRVLCTGAHRDATERNEVGNHEEPWADVAFIRRSRGCVPSPLRLPVAVPAEHAILACGAHQKNTFCLARGDRAWLGPHIGDLENYETLRSFEDGIAHLERLLEIEPDVVAHDLHPDYLSTKYALARPCVATLAVQHHHAHLAACLAERGERGPAVGAIYDGTGMGSDGTIWGGELLVGDLHGFERVGHLRPVRLPGGAAAVREPWRMACAWLLECDGIGAERPPWLHGVSPEQWSRVATMVERGIASPITTSMGRLFDAVACLATGRTRITYQGQAAIELEAIADPSAAGAHELRIEQDGEGAFILDARAAIRATFEDAQAGVPASTIATRFHRGLARATAEACAEAARARGLGAVVLSGGVFQNALLLAWTAALLSERGLRVLVPRLVPANDGGIAYGQAAIAAVRSA